MAKLPRATHEGEVEIGDEKIPCANLDNGERVLSERSVTKALGGKRGGAHWRRKKADPDGANLPAFISAKNLKPFIDSDLEAALTPVEYRSRTGGKSSVNGVLATSLPMICDAWLKAREANALLPSQEHIAQKAEILMRGLAHVGIVALVDEATGYQRERDRRELHKILSAYISEELLKWAKRFPDNFYRELFRLRGWQYHPLSVKRPKYVGKLTNELVYEQLPPGVLEELRRRNPPNKKGQRRHKHHQFLTDDIGSPHLEKQITSVVTLMRVSSNWREFQRLFQRAFKPETPEQTFLFPELDEPQG